AVGANGAAGAPEALLRVEGFVAGRGDLLVRPGVSSIGRGGDEKRLRQCHALLLAPERRETDVHVPKEWAARGVVGPDLLLVAERCRGLLRDDHRVLPCAGVTRGCRRGVVGA